MDRQAEWIVVYELRANHGLPSGEAAFTESAISEPMWVPGRPAHDGQDVVPYLSHR
jgi:hypothetical protein